MTYSSIITKQVEDDLPKMVEDPSAKFTLMKDVNTIYSLFTYERILELCFVVTVNDSSKFTSDSAAAAVFTGISALLGERKDQDDLKEAFILKCFETQPSFARYLLKNQYPFFYNFDKYIALLFFTDSLIGRSVPMLLVNYESKRIKLGYPDAEGMIEKLAKVLEPQIKGKSVEYDLLPAKYKLLSEKFGLHELTIDLLHNRPDIRFWGPFSSDEIMTFLKSVQDKSSYEYRCIMRDILQQEKEDYFEKRGPSDNHYTLEDYIFFRDSQEDIRYTVNIINDQLPESFYKELRSKKINFTMRSLGKNTDIEKIYTDFASSAGVWFNVQDVFDSIGGSVLLTDEYIKNHPRFFNPVEIRAKLIPVYISESTWDLLNDHFGNRIKYIDDLKNFEYIMYSKSETKKHITPAYFRYLIETLNPPMEKVRFHMKMRNIPDLKWIFK